jgi:hypothetical protein
MCAVTPRTFVGAYQRLGGTFCLRIQGRSKYGGDSSIFRVGVKWKCEPGSSVSIVSGYGLDDWAIEVRSPAGAKDFSCSLCVQTSSEAHPASCTMGTGGPFPGVKRGQGV